MRAADPPTSSSAPISGGVFGLESSFVIECKAVIEPTLEQSAFLRQWHARYAGLASATFGYGRVVGNGRSSYELLVDDVAALPSVKTVVDLGCADGFLIEMLAKRFPSAQLVGVDMSPEELEF